MNKDYTTTQNISIRLWT